jgi:hypothetical protein
MVAEAQPIATHRIGKFEFDVVCEPEPAEPQDRSEQRASALAAWLLAEWQREQGRTHVASTSDN